MLRLHLLRQPPAFRLDRDRCPPASPAYQRRVASWLPSWRISDSKAGEVAGGVGEGGAETDVKFDGGGLLGDIGDVGTGDACAGDDDAVGLHRTSDAVDSGNPGAI